jgi:hypothetical protein
VNGRRWWGHLKGDPTSFVLSDDEPGATWRFLVEVAGRPLDSPAVVRARRAARVRGAVSELLARQSPLGYWGSPAGYAARWGGSAWHVMALAALGADAEDARVARGAETLLELLAPSAGGFATARHRPVSACFTAETCAAMVRLGFAHHPRVREAVAWLAETAGEQGGWTCPEPRHLFDGCCPGAAVAALRLVAELPPAERPPLTRLARRAAGWLLARGLFVSGKAPRGWLKLAHPNLARPDVLEALWGLARLRWPVEPPVPAAVLALLAKQDEHGRWTSEAGAPFGETLHEPSRWLTLKALVVLERYGEAPAGAGEGA